MDYECGHNHRAHHDTRQLSIESWRTHSCVQRSHSCERIFPGPGYPSAPFHRATSQPDPGPNGGAFWEDESLDYRVRDEAELDRLIHYVEYNPVSAGLAKNPRAWSWSSANPCKMAQLQNRLKTSDSQDCLPHKSSLNAEIFAFPEDLSQVALEDLAGSGLRQRLGRRTRSGAAF